MNRISGIFFWTIIILILAVRPGASKTKRIKMQAAINSYTVAPTTVELDLNRNRSGFLLLSNNTRNTYKIKIKAQYFKPNELLVGKHLSDETAKIEDISRLIIISPRVVKLGPMSKRKVRFSLRPDGKKREPGEYRASFVFTPVINPEAVKPDNKGKGLVTQINWILEIRLPVYVTVGERGEARIMVESKKFKKDGKTLVRLHMKNPTKWRYPVEFTLLDSKTKEKIGEKSIVVLRETENTIEVPLEKSPKGSIVIRWKSYLQNIPAESGALTLQD